ncbi:MAG: hypothetical protein L0Y72_21225 [Gemmataceae bacterium]|nr:hypothetical protein [Gemmataceae bacterium]
MPERELLCLANSRKRGGRCVAGLTLDDGRWLRAVSAADDGTLFPSDYRYDNGTEPSPLEVVSIGFVGPEPSIHQPENWVIDKSRWHRVSRPLDESLVRLLQAHVETGPDLLRGRADRVPWESFQRQTADKSLTLVTPEIVELYRKANLKGKYLARGRFTLAADISYDLGLTDPVWEPIVVGQEGRIVLRRAQRKILLLLSMSEPFEGNCFKLIATLLLVPPEWAEYF